QGIRQKPTKQLVTRELPGKQPMTKGIQQRQMREQHIQTMNNRSYFPMKLRPVRLNHCQARPALRLHHHPETLSNGMKRHKEITGTIRMPPRADFLSRSEKRSAGTHRRGYLALQAAQFHFAPHVRALA